GWQSQSGVTTVQDFLEAALSSVAAEPVRVVTAGRTDTGVHANGQVAHFNTTAERTSVNWVRGTNTNLPAGLVLTWVKEVDKTFHARFSALSRRYRYIFFCRDVRPTYLAQRVSWTYDNLDVQHMRAAAICFEGRHDFSAFRASGCQAKQPVKEIYELTVNSSGPWIWIDVEADGFLQHMVRNIAGVLTAIGAGARSIPWAKEVLEGRDRTLGGVTALPDGLYLSGVRYPGHFHIPPPPEPCRYW
ncbi:MAG TPA: tRNA pseudouridine(38-40) synthase TruA, partial [Gammaproteobacteria bacterium]|nr:tRNA pseudouridine(38-40) synthase TruA [Gammaproteobacteria bacterium]